MVCTYNSRNGPRGPKPEAADALLKDTQERFSLDNRRLYACGFSGGARVASLVAMLSGKINSVVACGAGFANDKKPVAGLRFSFFGMVGSFDMNFQELFKLDMELSELKINHQMEYYEDGHNWPDVKIFERAFYWLELNAMRKKLIPVNDTLINTFKSFYQEDLQTLSPLNNTYWQYHLEQKFINYLHDLTDVSEYEIRATEIYESQAYKNESDHLKRMIDLENEKRRDYQEELNKIAKSATIEGQASKSKSWWKKELEILYVSDATPMNSDKLYVNKRLYDYIWRVAWGRYEDYFSNNYYNTAKRFMEICELANPDKPWPNYYLARLYVKMGNDNIAIKQLNLAVDKGYKNKKFLEQDPDLEQLRENKKFKELLDRIEIGN
ncbi:MAG: hypothetical protein R2764_18465 [Bacteroidales bacterium]